MFRQRLIFVSLSALFLAFVLVERHWLVQLREESALLRSHQPEVERLEAAQQELHHLKTQPLPAVASLPRNPELPRLRNEVRQLRQQQADLESLRAQNEKFRAQLATNTTSRAP